MSEDGRSSDHRDAWDDDWDEPDGERGTAREGGRGGRRKQPGSELSARVSGEAWNIFGRLIAGTAFWGLVGFGLDRLFDLGTVFLPIGAVVGMAGSLYLTVYRMTRM